MVTRRGRAGAALLRAMVSGVVGGALCGCAGEPPPVETGQAGQALAPAETEALLATMRERARALSRLWARATVEVRFTDEKGRKRWEQGDGHLQFVSPSRFALSVGKFGEDALYLGCDEEVFWVFERGKDSSVALCRHENAGTECAKALALPASPGLLLHALGLEAPEPMSVAPTPSGREAIVVSRAGGDAMLALTVDRASGEPRSGLLRGRAGSAVAITLEKFEAIDVVGPRFVPPRVPTRVVIRDTATGDELRLFLADATNGKPEQLPDEAFDLAFLVDAFAPERVIVLDRDCERPARVPASATAP